MIHVPDIVLTVCRDEADIIEAFIRFHLDMGFDKIYAVDNGSTDGTDLILQRLADEGLPLTWKRDARTGYDLHLSEHYHWAGSEAKPRWLFFLDVDEYVYFPNGSKDYLGSVPDEVTALRLLQRQMYQQTLEPVEHDPWFFLRTPAAGTTFDDEPSKLVTRYDPDARVYGGKHLIEGPTLCEVIPDDLYIRHFKYRSAAQARSKERNRVESESVFTDNDIQQLSAFTWQETKEWMRQCRDMADREEWRSWFSPERSLAFDDVLARWTARGTRQPVQELAADEVLSLPAPERLLAIEAQRQTAVSYPNAPAVALSGVTEHFAGHAHLLGAQLTDQPEGADLLLIRADASSDLAQLVRWIATSLRPRARALVRVEPSLIAALVHEGRNARMHTMRFGRTLYGEDTLVVAGLDREEQVISITPLERPEPATRNRTL